MARLYCNFNVDELKGRVVLLKQLKTEQIQLYGRGKNVDRFPMMFMGNAVPGVGFLECRDGAKVKKTCCIPWPSLARQKRFERYAKGCRKITEYVGVRIDKSN